MKKKLLSFILAVCLIMPCALVLSACGNNPPPENPHTHEWVEGDWKNNATEHWHWCKGCDEKKDKGNPPLPLSYYNRFCARNQPLLCNFQIFFTIIGLRCCFPCLQTHR